MSVADPIWNRVAAPQGDEEEDQHEIRTRLNSTRGEESS